MNKELGKKLLKWSVKWGGYLATVVSILWSILLLLAAKDDLNLLVWVKQDTVLYPSEQTWKEPLPLTFQNSSATSVRLLSVTVSNYGKNLIGEQKAVWNLNLEAPSSSHLVVIGKPEITPEAIVVGVLPGQKSNAITLEVGALEPRASISLRIMLLNTTAGKYPLLRAEPSLAGLPHEITLRSPVDRLFERLVWAIMITVLMLLLVVDGPKTYEKASRGKSGFKLLVSLFSQLIRSLILAMIGGALLAQGLAYVVAWFI